MRAEEYRKRRETVGAFEIGIESYRLGDTYFCSVDNVDPGAVIARGNGPTREQAEEVAVGKARDRIRRTRIHEV